nr:hypothetical protein Iba_chr01bCG4700 [Ipomoea batatas]
MEDMILSSLRDMVLPLRDMVLPLRDIWYAPFHGIWYAPFYGIWYAPVMGYGMLPLWDIVCSLSWDMVCSRYGIWNLIKCLMEKSALVECISRWMILIFQKNKVLDL